MNSNNIFTIIILSYNNLQFIKDCLKSVLSQTYPYIEIVISDDSSTDFNRGDIEKFINSEKKSNIINLIINQNEHNLGVVKNLNKGIKLGNGNYFMNLACDDKLYDCNVIENIVNYFNKTNYLATTGIICAYDENMKNALWSNPSIEDINFLLNSNPYDVYKALCKRNFISGPGFSYTKELLEKYGLYDEKYHLLEDYPRSLYLTRNGCSIGCLNIPIIKYRKGGVTTQNPSDDNFHIRQKIYNDLELIKNNEIKPYTNI